MINLAKTLLEELEYDFWQAKYNKGFGSMSLHEIKNDILV